MNGDPATWKNDAPYLGSKVRATSEISSIQFVIG